jgi:hypothetical protein
MFNPAGQDGADPSSMQASFDVDIVQPSVL